MKKTLQRFHLSKSDKSYTCPACPSVRRERIRRKSVNFLSSLFFYLSILLFVIGFNFTDAPPAGGWYQQFMPTPTGGQIRDIFFVDSLLGFAVSDSSILKTTNRGDNWTVKISGYYIFRRVQFLNANIGFACGGNNKLLKTTNSGENWTIMTPSSIYPYDMSVLNEDTIWLVDNNSLVGGVFRTTNGGGSWQLRGPPCAHIYMYNARIGFIDAGGLRKTTDGGNNWFSVASGSFTDMYFVDSLTGWRAYGTMRKTTDGGLNWITQTLPSGGMIITSGVYKFSNINRDTIWAVGGYINTSLGARGMIYRTINSGNNWLFQVPDTNINIFQYYHNRFINKQIGWAYAPLSGVHTTTGGDPIFYTSVKQLSSSIPKDFKLLNNYPNPFNPETKIGYELKVASYVKLIVYDITGKIIDILVDQKQEAGRYETVFNGSELSSGIYFYSLFVDEKLIDTKGMVLLK